MAVTLSDVLSRFGWRTLAQFAGLTVLYLLLRLLRLPLLAVLAALAAGTRAIDHAVATRMTTPTPPANPRWRTA